MGNNNLNNIDFLWKSVYSLLRLSLVSDNTIVLNQKIDLEIRNSDIFLIFFCRI